MGKIIAACVCAIALAACEAESPPTSEPETADAAMPAPKPPAGPGKPKGATDATKAANDALLNELPFADVQSFADAKKGLIAPLPSSLIKGEAGNTVWDPTQYDFIEEGDREFAEFALECAESRRFMKDAIVQSLFEIATDRLHPQATKAAKELLSCLYPKEFSSVRHVVQHKQEQDPEIDLSLLSQEELRAFHKTLKRVTKGDDSEHQALPPTAIDVVSNGKS